MRALIICTLLLLHGTLSLAALGFTSSGIPPLPQCTEPCTGRPGECPTQCKHCRRFRGTNGPVCGGSYG
uniref:Putative 5.3 kDa protein n=1 Tax=Ixodes ricinus TaxID=34613 RepID=A0A0K8RG56_IXORI